MSNLKIKERMKTFNELFEGVIKHEGYYANVIGDRGGETYMGVARNLHPNWNVIEENRFCSEGYLPRFINEKDAFCISGDNPLKNDLYHYNKLDWKGLKLNPEIKKFRNISW